MNRAVRRLNFPLTGILLAISAVTLPVASGKLSIPAWSFVGLDLENIWKFHHCDPVRNHPYSSLTNGAVCDDSLARNMNYPPLMYWSFAWTRAFSFETALKIWTAAMVILLSVCLWWWRPLARPSGNGIDAEVHPRLISAIFLGLLLVHYPFLFAIERSNNDVLVVVLWTLSMRLAIRRESIRAGLFAGLAVAAKIYPLFALAIATCKRPERWKYLAGAAAAGLGTVFILARDTWDYRLVVAAFANEQPPQHVYSHGLPTFFVPLAALLIASIIVVPWILAAVRLADHDVEGSQAVLAGGLAVSTFFARTSYDYNLVTVYPLAMVLFERSRGAEGSERFYAGTALAILLLTVLGDRYLYRNTPALLVFLESVAIGFAGWTVLRSRRN